MSDISKQLYDEMPEYWDEKTKQKWLKYYKRKGLDAYRRKIRLYWLNQQLEEVRNGK